MGIPKQIAPKIIILTPVKDEAWVLERFLAAISEVADHALVLDQKSEDESRAICARFPKVTVIENPSGDYSESERSMLLIEGARRLFGVGNLLVALDADEIIAGSSLYPDRWNRLRELAPGVVIYFEKPEMLPNPSRCVRTLTPEWFPIGLIDDGAAFHGQTIHSRRLPIQSGAVRHYAEDIKIMHFARLRTIEYATRQAFYCMVENVKKTKNHRVRNCYYSPFFFRRFGRGLSEPCPSEWFDWFESRGLDLWSYEAVRFNSFHKRALRLMSDHGVRHFWQDDIWWEDWEAARLFFVQEGDADVSGEAIEPPSAFYRWRTSCLLRVYAVMTQVASVFRGLGSKQGPRKCQIANSARSPV